MKAVLLKEWPSFLLAWAKPPQSGGSPVRQEISILGEIPDLEGNLKLFEIGRSRDVYGTVLHLKPSQDLPIILGRVADNRSDKSKPEPERNKNAEKHRDEWNLWWAKLAVRSGYLSPQIDPVALSFLNDLRYQNTRVEFIVDTNILINGVGHWLVRYMGDLCDLVRTVVTDLEVQRFGDKTKWNPKTFDELSARGCYLASSRFLECLREQHPVWRRLDIEEETALFVASASTQKGEKDQGNDILLLRAVRRSIQDQVPGLIRMFVTSDQKAARTALHDLPPNSTVAANITKIPAGGTYLTSIHWWPSHDGDGAGYVSNLATFAYESMCLCDAVRLVKADKTYLRLGTPDRTQFPSDWREPVVWVDESDSDNANGPSIAKSTKIDSAATPLVELPEPTDSVEPVSQGESESVRPMVLQTKENRIGITVPPRAVIKTPRKWPLENLDLRDPVFCTARASGPAIMDVLTSITTAVLENRSLSKRVFPGATVPARELRTFLRAVELIDDKDQPGPSAIDLPDIFATDATDRLSQIMTRASGYNSLIDGLRHKTISSLDSLNLPSRSSTALAGLARLLGQAVKDEGKLVYGGGSISKDEFIAWFIAAIEQETKGPLGDALIADISRKALYEISLSPMRLEKALRAVMADESQLAELEFSAGGTPEKILEEEIAELSAKQWTRRTVGADGLLGYRSVRRRK